MEDLSVSRWSVVVGRWVGGTLVDGSFVGCLWVGGAPVGGSVVDDRLPVGGSVVGDRLPVGGRWFCNTPKFVAVNMNQKFTKVTKVFIFVIDTFCTDPARKFVIIGITHHQSSSIHYT